MIFTSLKSYFYLILWKVIDFVGGLSDIRDSHITFGLTSLFPSMIRIFVVIFIIYPINLLAFLGIFIYFKKIYNSGLWINLIAAFSCLSNGRSNIAIFDNGLSSLNNLICKNIWNHNR